MFNKLTPNMMVKDVRETIAFYQEVLGFEFVMAVPKDGQEVSMEMPQEKPLAYAMMKSGNVEIMFQAKESLSEDIPTFQGVKIGASVSFYFEIDNIDAFYEDVGEKVEVVKRIHTVWYGMREFYIRDCNGYILGFSQQTPP